MSAAAVSVCYYVTHFIALFSDYQSQSKQAPLQPIKMEPNPVTVPNDDDVVTVGAVFENPFFVFFCVSGKDFKYFFFFLLL